MKKINCLLLMFFAILSVAILSSCSKDNDVVEEVTPVYKVRIANNIDKSQVAQKSDGKLYDVCIVCSDGKVYKVGDVANGDGVTYELPSTTKEGCVVFVIVKVGTSASAAASANYWTPQQSAYTSKILAKPLTDGVTVLFNFTEDTVYAQMKYSNYEDVAKYAANLVGE